MESWLNAFQFGFITGGILAELQGGQFGHGFLVSGSGFAMVSRVIQNSPVVVIENSPPMV